MRNQIFISYSHKDREWLDKLQTMLVPLRRNNSIDIWDDSQLKAGDKWKVEIEKVLGRARVALLLVSPYFLASEFISNNELPPLLEAAEKKGLTILWVAISDSLYQETQIESYQALNDPSTPLDTLTPAVLSRELVKISKQIKAAASAPIEQEEKKPSPPGPTPENAHAPSVSLTSLKISLLYRRKTNPDEQLLEFLEHQLRAIGHQVFIDRHLAIGMEWAKQIQSQISNADVIIPILSAASVMSDMLAGEIQMAFEESQKHNGSPRIMPVRVNYEGPPPEPLAGILEPIQYFLWRGPEDNQRLIAELTGAIMAPPSVESFVLQALKEPVVGGVPLNSNLYIVRPTDQQVLSAVAQHESIVLIKGARQMGKTSLLARSLQLARESQDTVVFTDFQKLNAVHLESLDTLCRALGEMIAYSLELDVLPDDVWKPRLGASINFDRYIKHQVLGKIKSSLVWGLDEVDRLSGYPFGTEFFSLVRTWHNERALEPGTPLERLTVIIAYATEDHMFITDPHLSPFNVGKRVLMSDFNEQQVRDLNKRYGSPVKNGEELGRFFTLLGGHPYLVRRGLYTMATENISLSDLEKKATNDDGPFGDHLHRILVLLASNKGLCDDLREILKGNACPSQDSFFRLRSAGVVAGEVAAKARPRCQLYADYLNYHLQQQP